MELYQQILSLVTEPAGRIALHLILAAAAGGALISAFSVWRQKKYPQGNRMISGLASLVALQLVLILSSWAGYPQSPGGGSGRLVLEQAGTLLAVLILIWLWVFPEPDQKADQGLLFTSSLIITLALVDHFLLLNQRPSPLTGLSWTELFWTFLPLLILSIGETAVLIRLPNGWIYGAGMLGILGLGYILALLLPPSNGSFPGAVRLAQLAAYPLLFTLPERFSGFPSPRSEVQEPPPPQETERARTSIPLPLISTILTFALSEEEPKRFYHLAQLTSQALIADVCLIVSVPEDREKTQITAGYDLIRQEPLRKKAIDSKNIPLLSTYIRQGKMLHLPSSSTSRDLIHLAQILQVGQSGHLLAAPLSPPKADKALGIVVMSPYSHRTWDPAAQSYLSELTDLVQDSQAAGQASPRGQIRELKNRLLVMDAKLEELEGEKAYLSQKLSDSHAIIEEAQKTITALQELKDQFSDLREQYQLLKDRERHLSELAFGETDKEQQQNLRLALMEIANLKEDLQEKEQRLKTISTPDGEREGYSLEQIEALTTFAQRLRSPLHSVMDFSQDTFDQSSTMIETLRSQLQTRLQTAHREIDGLLNEVLEGPARSFSGVEGHPADLNQALQVSLRNAKYRMRSKDITADIEVPRDNPPLDMDHYALVDILMVLISSAVKRTPTGGEVLIRGTRYDENSQHGFAYLKIADHSEGIPARLLAMIFQDPEEDPPPLDPDLSSELIYFSAVKNQVEEQGGRMWIDSDPDTGITISLLLPYLRSSPD